MNYAISISKLHILILILFLSISNSYYKSSQLSNLVKLAFKLVKSIVAVYKELKVTKKVRKS